MSYYAVYDLDVDGIRGGEDYNELIGRMNELELFDDIFDNDAWESANGIYHFYRKDIVPDNPFDDIVKISKEFPWMTFFLQEHGESADEIWGIFIKDGEDEQKQAVTYVPEPLTIEWRGDLEL